MVVAPPDPVRGAGARAAVVRRARAGARVAGAGPLWRVGPFDAVSVPVLMISIVSQPFTISVVSVSVSISISVSVSVTVAVGFTVAASAAFAHLLWWDRENFECSAETLYLATGCETERARITDFGSPIPKRLEPG